MRVAFLTPEFPSEYSVEGVGLGSYIHRMVRSLMRSGHEPEVFVPSQRGPQELNYDGICVHRVNCKNELPLLRALFRPEIGVGRIQRWRTGLTWILQAKSLAAALERRHAVKPFALVQSSDFMAVGLAVRRCRNRVHVVRCSSAADLYNDADSATSKLDWWRTYLERLSIKHADLAYAPSQFIAEYFARRHGMDVQVIRPPRELEIESSSFPRTPLPDRFFFHFGQLIERKGTALLAKALRLAWEAVPDLTMIWSGRCDDARKLTQWQSLWGDRARQVHITGPLPKSELYAVLMRADAAVLPSQADNLPNTVIESLMLGVPVIGSRGASIDELVDDGVNGHLVALGDVDGLADALVKMWRGDSAVAKGFKWNSVIAEEMRPERAVANLVALANVRTTH
jgi:glycogen synthase